MSQDQLEYVSGEFEGYFYTHQKVPMGEMERLPGGKTHKVHIYRGEINNHKKLEEYNPNEHLNRDGLLLHNVTNIQINDYNTSEKRIYHFDQLVLKDVHVEQSWELGGKTYGIIKGHLIGKIKKNNSANSDKPIPPPIPHKDPTKNCWERLFQEGGSFGNSGCFSKILNILKWLLLIMLLVFLYKNCFKRSETNYCCIEIEGIKKINDSLLITIDSLENTIRKNDSLHIESEEEIKIQDEINDVTERIYFYGNSDEIREYSENSIQQLINILKTNNDIKLEIQGHTNGKNPLYEGLDIRRAERVKRLLISNGIEPIRLTTVGMSNQKPIVSEKSIEFDPGGNEYNANMRVEIKIRK